MAEPEGGTDPPVPGKEDIPTFDEWKKKVMEVEEKKSKRIMNLPIHTAHAEVLCSIYLVCTCIQ